MYPRIQRRVFSRRKHESELRNVAERPNKIRTDCLLNLSKKEDIEPGKRNFNQLVGAEVILQEAEG